MSDEKKPKEPEIKVEVKIEEVKLEGQALLDKNKVELVEGVRDLANHCFEAASKIEVTSRQINEKMKFMISVDQMSMGFAHVLGTINGLSIAAVRVLQKLNSVTSRILEETHPDQVEVPLAPKAPTEAN